MPERCGGPTHAWVGIGSNLDDPRSQVLAALASLARIPGTRIVRVSSLYQSAPYGVTDQPDFINAVALLSTALDARSLLGELQAIEKSQGRVRQRRWGPRTIDLDLLVYGSSVINEEDLTVPHPGIAERNFVLLPLQEISPDLEIPGLGRIAGMPVDEEPRIARLDQAGLT